MECNFHKFLFLLIPLIDGILNVNSAKILAVVPDKGRSHFNFHSGIMESLANAGHLITLISPFRDPNGHVNIKYVNYAKDLENSEDLMASDFKSMSHWQFFYTDGLINLPQCYEVYELPEIQNVLKSDLKMYDILFTEMTIMSECYVPLAKKLGIPVIGTAPMRYWITTDEMFDNWSRFVIPNSMSTFPLKMGPIQRLKNVVEAVYIRFLYTFLQKMPAEKFQQQFFPEFSSQPNYPISLLFRNNHESIFSTPAGSTVIDIAGIHLNPIKPLPRDLEKFINDSKDGVILFTFGSIMKSNVINTQSRTIFRDAFAELPQRIIWKFEENIEKISDNVLISKWVPQRDILAHKNVKAFITHGGASGFYEAIDAAVPMVIIPAYGDQCPNAALIEEKGVGIFLDMDTITKETLLQALNDVLHKKAYAEGMQKLSKQFRDRPLSPQESVVYWTEYVLRHNGTDHMKLVTADIPSYEYLLLYSLIIVFMFYWCLYILRKIYKCGCKIFARKNSKKTKKNKKQ